MNNVVQAALNARNEERKKKEQELYSSSVSRALAEREKTLDDSLSANVPDWAKRISTTVEEYNKHTSSSAWGSEYLENARQTAIDAENLIRESELYRKYLGDDKTDEYLSYLNTIKDNYTLRSSFDSEDAYKAWYEEYLTTTAQNEKYAEMAKSEQGKLGWEKYLADVEAAEIAKAEKEASKPWWEKLLGYYGNAGIGDTSMPMGNVPQVVDDVRNGVGLTDSDPRDTWTDEQKRVYGYLYQESKAEAASYARTVNAYNAKYAEEEALRKIAEASTSSGWAMAGNTIGAIVSAPLAMGDLLSDLVNSNAGKEIKEYDGVVSPFEYSQAVTGGIGEHLNKYGTLDEDIPIIGGKGFGDVYGLGTSILQSAASGYTLGGVGTLVSYFGQGAAAGIDDAKRRGASDAQAVGYGILLGAFEGIAESIGIDNLFKLSNSRTLKELLKNVFKQAGAEGLEEGLTSIASNIADAWIMQDKSNFNIALQEYMRNGMSESDAKWKVFWDSIEGIVYDTLGGAVSGGVHGGFHTAITSALSSRETTKYGKSLIANKNSVPELQALAREMMGVSKDVDKLSQKVTNKATPKSVGRLAVAMQDSIKSQNLTDVTNALVEKGLSQKEAKEVAEKLINNESLSKKQMSNEAIKAVAEEVVNNPASSMNERKAKLRNAQVGVKTNLSETQPGEVAVNKKVDVTDRVSADGVTKQNSTGEAITIDKSNPIAKTKDGKVYFNTDKGVVESSDVSYASADEGLIYEAFVDMNPAFANAIIRNYDGKTPVQSYIKGMREGVVIYGRHNFQGIGKDISGATYFAELSEADQAFALKLGRNYATYEAKVKDAPVRQMLREATKRANTEGANKTAKTGTVGFEKGTNKHLLNKEQRGVVELANHLVKALGIDIVFYDARTKKEGENGYNDNGFYDPETNTIHLDLQKSHYDNKTIAYTLSHELVHWLKAKSATDFNNFAKFLMEQYAEHGVDTEKLLDKWIEKGYTADEAYEEMICDACETLLLDSNAVVKLMKLREQDMGLFERIKLHIAEILNKLRNMYKKYDGRLSDEAKALRSMTDVLEQIYEKFEDAMVGAAKNADLMENLEAVQNSNKTVFGEASIDVKTVESGVKNQLKAHRKTGEASIAYNDKHKNVQKAILQTGVEAMFEMAETMLPYLEQDGILPPDIPGKTIFKNGSYGKTGENTTLCVRTLTYEDFKDRVAEKVGRPLTVSESLLVSQKIYDIATEPQCIYCYVAADRKAYDEYLGEYHKAMDKYIKALRKGGDSQALYTEYLAGRKDTDAQKKRWSQWEAIAKSGKEYISASDLTTKRKRDRIIEKKNAFSEQIKDAQRYAQSASWAKTVCDYRAYKGDILKMTSKFVDMLNSEYGLRMYSFSDYTPAFIVENMQMIIDASVKGLKSLAYTKDTDYVEIFASTGQAINVSCFARWDAELGTFVEDNRQGANWEKTKNLRKQYRNVGAVMVATNDAMVEWALKQDWIDVVIPYHIVKTGTTIANEYQWNNYTSESSDKSGSRAANIYPTEHNNDFATYSNLLNERGITPRFSRWYDKVASGEITEAQYMKLVNEVRLPASELSPVVPRFNLEAAKRSFGVDNDGNVIKGGFVDKGGYMGGWYRQGVDVNQEVMAVSEDINAGKSSLEVDYGMSKSAKEKVEQRYVKKQTENATSTETIANETWGNIINEVGSESIPEATELYTDVENTKKIKKQAKKNPSSYDTRLDSLLDEKTSIQSRLSELRRAKEKIESSEEYTALIDRIVSDSDMAAAFDAYTEWMSNSKYGEISDEIASLEKRADELSREYNEIVEQGFADEDKAEIEKRGLSESDYYRKKAIKVFGYTPYFYDAGYLLPNGKLLNFSGEKGSHHGSRGQDHRAIETIYAKETRSDAMLRFMSEGNIRVMAETPGLDISSVAEPTAEQYRTIKNFVREYSKEGYMAVDITDRNGNVVGTYSYENNINADRVVNDIKYYFENGTPREQSSLSKFRHQKKKNAPNADDILSFNGEPFWIGMVNNRTGDILKTWTKQEAEAEAYDLERYVDFSEEDGYTFFTSDLLQDNGQIEYDDYGDRLSDFLIKRINEQIDVLGTKQDEMSDKADFPFTESFDDDFTFDDWLNGKGMRFQKKKVSNRTILANALETTIDTSTQEGQNELKKLKEYQGVVAELDNLEAHLADVMQQIHDISFTKGSDRSKLTALNDDKIKTQNRIHIYDSQLTKLEAMKPIQDVLAREKEAVRVKTEAKAKEAFDAYKEQIQTVHEEDIGREREVRREAISREKRRSQEAEVAHRWEIAELREKMSNLRKEMANAVGEERQKKREAIDKLRERHAQLVRDLKNRHQESTKKGIEGRSKTALKRKLRKVIGDLNKIFSHGTKERNVKKGAQDAVASALALGEILFSDEISNADIVTLGVDSVTEKESKWLNEYRDALDMMDALLAENEVNKAKYSGEELVKRMNEIADKIDKLQNKINRLNTQLSDVFKRERARLNRSTVASLIDQLAKDYKSLASAKEEYLKNAFEEKALAKIEQLSADLEGTLVKDMSLDQLEEVYKVFKMVKHMVTEANKLFRDGKTEDLMQRVNGVQRQLLWFLKLGKKDPMAKSANAKNLLKAFWWNEMKPLTAFEALGSDAFKELFWDAVKADGEFAKLITEAGSYLQEQREKYHYADWDINTTKEFTLSDGKVFKLTLGDIMSIYAYTKRDQAYDHMTNGGFTFDENNHYKGKLFNFKNKNSITEILEKLRVERKHAKLTETYLVDDAILNEIVKLMYSKEYADIKAYTDAMQEYFKVMAQKGNEISNILYGIDLFGEEFYIPLQSSSDYMNSTKEALNNAETQVSLKNMGMTKATKPHASNPIVLRQFDELWLDHIDKMSKYCAYVLPIENLQRVFNNVASVNGQSPISTKALIASIFGNEARDYIDQYITDLNGGSKGASGYKNPLMSMFAKFKKTAVGAKLSVVIQQPLAIIRAMSEIRPDYFVPFLHGISKTQGIKVYEELKKYAPVAILKEMGGFDIGSSGSVKSYIGTTEYHGLKGKAKGLIKDADYRSKAIDDSFMFGATKMDELGWSIIWLAVKKEVADQNKYAKGSEEFLNACGERFQEVVLRTQVYDSVNSRSGMMRSKSDATKFAISFAGEPTTIVNMYISDIINLARAIKFDEPLGKPIAKVARDFGVITASIIITTLAKTAIYANYDDDEDESWTERWMRNFGDSLTSDLNPLTMLPWVRDVVSIWEGWTIERPDMALLADLTESVRNIFDETREGEVAMETVYDLIGDMANALGIPAKNIVKDTKGIVNVIQGLFDDVVTTDAWGAFKEGWSGGTLYDAYISGDEKEIEYHRKHYDTTSDFYSALSKALRENDSRIKEAAQADIDGDISEYNRIVSEILDEGHFNENIIKSAINSEINKLTEDDDETDSEPKKKSIYDTKHYGMAIEDGNISLANKIKEDIIETHIENGKSRDAAESAFESSLRTYYRDEYKDGNISRTKATSLLITYGGLDSNEAYWKLKEWDYYIANGTTDGYSKYTEFYEAVRTGSNLKAVINEHLTYGAKKSDLASQITKYYKPLYKEMSVPERTRIKGYLLNAYALLGYNRSEKSKDIDNWLKD